jgi:hypothetical protein
MQAEIISRFSHNKQKGTQTGVLFALGGRKRDSIEGKSLNASGLKTRCVLLTPDISRTNKRKTHPNGCVFLLPFALCTVLHACRGRDFTKACEIPAPFEF